MKNVETKPVPGLSGFYASACGTVLHGERIVGLKVMSRGGYLVVDIGRGATRVAHRLVWEAFNGAIPDDREIDHIDGDPTNNALANLRLATRRENCRNRVRRYRNNKSGWTGVQWFKKGQKWRAYIQTELGHKHLGCFARLDEAIAARRAAELAIYGEFAPRAAVGL